MTNKKGISRSRDEKALRLFKSAQKAHAVYRFADAERDYRQVLSQMPTFHPARVNLAMVQAQSGKISAAWETLVPISTLEFAETDIFTNASWVALKIGRFEDGARFAERAIAQAPQHRNAWLNLSNIYREQRRFAESENASRRVVEIDPGYGGGYLNLGNILLDTGRHAEAEEQFRKALKCAPESAHMWNNLLFCMTNNAQRTGREIAKDAREFGNYFIDKHVRRPQSPASQCSRRLKLGFVSGDFRTHAVIYFLEPLLARLNRKAFEIVLYSNHHITDGTTTRIKRYADTWVDAFALDEDALERKIRSDQIDILIDIAGHSAANRLTIFARKPAPIQLTWLGYPGTTGLKTIDWRITDWMADQAGSEENYVEKLWRLPNIFCCYRPCTRRPVLRHQLAYEPREAPVVTNGFVTFGSCNNPAKITDSVLIVWGRVLSQVPNSRLLVEGKGLGEASVVENFLTRCEKAQIDRQRLILVPLDSANQYLTYHRIDIALDTFPMTGGTTTFDALWMGVPVVSLAGKEFRNRISTTILHAAGFDHWICESVEHYVACAVSLSGNTDILNRLRFQMRAKIENSPAMNASDFAGDFGQALRKMWEQYCYDSNGVDSENPIAWKCPVVVEEPVIYLEDGSQITVSEGARRAELAVGLGDEEGAIRWCEAVLWELPKDACALASLAAIARRRKSWPEYYAYLSHAIDSDPENERLYHELIEMSCLHGRTDTVLMLLNVLAKRLPLRFDSWSPLVKALNFGIAEPLALMALIPALPFSNNAISISNEMRGRELLGQAVNLIQAHRSMQALPLVQKAVDLIPQVAEAWTALCAIHVKQHCYVEAMAAGRRAVELDPHCAHACNNLAIAVKGLGRLDECIQLQKKALALAPKNVDLAANYLLNCIYSDAVDARDLLNLAEKVAERLQVPLKNKMAEFKSLGDRIRIAFLSPDFNSHPVMYCLAPVIAHLDRRRFSVVAYHMRSYRDEVTAWVERRVDIFRSVSAHSAEAVARQIQSDQVDVLIDLAGYTGGTGLAVLAYKPAPVQITWLGYPGTTGLPEVDWKLSDEILDPEGSEQYYSEKLWRLQGPFCIYRPLIRSPLARYDSDYQVQISPGLTRGHVTFGSCNNLTKASPRIIALWQKVLEAVPNSRLLLESRAVNDQSSFNCIKQHLSSCGLDLAQVDWVPRSTEKQYLVYHKIDIVLDTAPMTGGVSTFDALWMGVPVVSLAGKCGRERLSASLLGAAGLAEWIAFSEDEYVGIASRLASDLQALNRRRLQLRAQIERGPLMNEVGFTRNFEAALLDMVHRVIPNRLVVDRAIDQSLCPSVPSPIGSVVTLDVARQEGNAAISRGDFGLARQWGEAILSSLPFDPQALDWLALEAKQAGRRSEAIAFASHALDNGKNDENRYRFLMEMFREDENWKMLGFILSTLQRYMPERAHHYVPLVRALGDGGVPAVNL